MSASMNIGRLGGQKARLLPLTKQTVSRHGHNSNNGYSFRSDEQLEIADLQPSGSWE
jgi:hypothetical protein